MGSGTPLFGLWRPRARAASMRRAMALGESPMKNPFTRQLAAAALLACSCAALTQSAQAASPSAPAADQTPADTREQNLAEDIRLMRKNVREEKARLLGTAMQLDADQAAKFWPIYKDYQTQLTRLSDLRAANILEYARTYSAMTDTKADELVNGVISFHKKRTELLANYYDKVKAALGATVAARFVQVESTLLTIIDLQIQSNLPLIWGPAQPADKP